MTNKTSVSNVELEQLNKQSDQMVLNNNILTLGDVPIEVTVRIGKTTMDLKDILTIAEGTIIPLTSDVADPIEVLANNKLIAYGEVVTVDEKFGVRITDVPRNKIE